MSDRRARKSTGNMSRKSFCSFFKKVAAFVGAWSLFWVGDFLSRVMGGFGFFDVYGKWPTHVLYRPYNFCMARSAAIEDWAGTAFVWKPWSEEKEKKEPL